MKTMQWVEEKNVKIASRFEGQDTSVENERRGRQSNYKYGVRKEKDFVCVCVYVYCRLFAQLRVCSFLYALCSYSFYRCKKRQTGEKRHIAYLLIFYFSFLLFLEYIYICALLFLGRFFDRNKKHRNIVWYKMEWMISIWDHHYCSEWSTRRIKCKERNDDLFICWRMENYDRLHLMTFSAKKNAKENNGEMKNRICLTRRHSVCMCYSGKVS